VASGYAAVVVGGLGNTNTGNYSTVGGGYLNSGGFYYSTIGGGNNNITANNYATVGGGLNDKASGQSATVGGGDSNSATDYYATVGGGKNNSASHVSATVSGGEGNAASGNYSAIMGGRGNGVSGDYSAVAAGLSNSVSGNYAFAAGRRARAQHNGTFVWADATDANFSSSDTNQFLVRAGNGMGINTASPAGALHIVNTAPGYTGAFNQTEPPALVLDAQNQNLLGSQIRFSNQGFPLAVIDQRGSSNSPNGGALNFNLYTPGSGMTASLSLSHAGIDLADDTTCHGQMSAQSFNTTSDRNVKTNFAAISAEDVLKKVIALPLSSWTFKADKLSVRHLGPMAQDFYAAFGLGKDDTHIATVDEEGVALAAIQGLNQKLEQARAENAELKQSLEELKQLVQVIAGKKAVEK
jgi:hypothetical protein